MAIAEATHYNLLNRWPLRMNENIWSFNQIGGSDLVNRSTPGVYIQHERDDIAYALHAAMDAIAEERSIGFYLRPTWVSEQLKLDSRGDYTRQTLRLKYGFIQQMGQRTQTIIAGGPFNVTYSDADSDGIQDTATITVNTTVAANEIQVFFQVADGAPAAADPRYQIDDVVVTSNGTVATITGHKALFVKPSAVWAKQYDTAGQRFVGSYSTGGNFVTAVDVYRVYNDPTNAVQLLMQPPAGTATPDTAVGVGHIRDVRESFIRVELATGQPVLSKTPYAVKIFYQAGYPLDNGRITPHLETAAIRLANASMPRQASFVDPVVLRQWTDDQQQISQAVSREDALNPFGLLAGQFEAWKILKRFGLRAEDREAEEKV